LKNHFASRLQNDFSSYKISSAESSNGSINGVGVKLGEYYEFIAISDGGGAFY